MGAATAGPVASEGSSRSETQIPARLDRLPWSARHRMILVGLGTVWILDGLEVTIVGNIADRLSQSGSGLHITSAQVTGAGAASYVAGACVGALFFGWLTDRFGRKRLFMVTLGVYLVAAALTGLSTEAWMFFLFSGLTGLGIGGEYAAINSAIDELIPKQRRGRIDLIINGTLWLGAAVGALLTIPALNTSVLPANLGWRLCFALGVVLGPVILLVRRNVPESFRWLVIHGRDPGRATLGMALFIGQALLYNAITFGSGSDPRPLLRRPDRPDRLLLRGDRRRQPARPDHPGSALRRCRAHTDDCRNVHSLRNLAFRDCLFVPPGRFGFSLGDVVLERGPLLRLGRGPAWPTSR